jgi:hypothetical protein
MLAMRGTEMKLSGNRSVGRNETKHNETLMEMKWQ